MTSLPILLPACHATPYIACHPHIDVKIQTGAAIVELLLAMFYLSSLDGC